jgi:hypothetical protein
MDRAYTAPVEVSRVENPFGYTYRLPQTSAVLLDRPQVVIQTIASPTLLGYRAVGSGTLPTGSFYERLEEAWEGMFVRLVEKCEAPPFNYTPATQELTDPTTLRFYHEHCLHIGFNLVILNALMQGVYYCEGMNTLADDFSGKYRRINDLLGWARSLVCLPLISNIIDKFARVVVPYPGGPIYAELMEAILLNWGSSDGITNWSAAIDLDRGVTSSDVVKLLLDDVERSYEEISGESADAEDKADYRLIRNIMTALGFPTMVVPERRIEENAPMWEYLQFYELFAFHDNKGAGTDTVHYHPIAADAESQIHRATPVGYVRDALDFMGIRANAAKASEVEPSGDNVVYGVLGLPMATTYGKKLHRVYTPEDGWFSTIGDLDLTAADSLQDYIWAQPWNTKHIFGAMAISSEDPEEQYFVYGPGRQEEWIQVHDHLAECYRVGLYRKEHGGFDVPEIR